MILRFDSISFDTLSKRTSFAKRLAAMLDSDFVPYCVGGAGESWRIEAGNNWFLTFISTNEIRLNKRLREEEDVRALAAWLNVLFRESITVVEKF